MYKHQLDADKAYKEKDWKQSHKNVSTYTEQRWMIETNSEWE